MGITNVKKVAIKDLLKRCILSKFQKYKPETISMPFHYKLLGKDRMALFSFIHSLNTTFGTSIYEPVAIELAKDRFKIAKSQVSPNNRISSEAHSVIQSIVDGIATTSREPNKIKELEEIRNVCTTGKFDAVKLTKVDIWLESHDKQLYLMDIKTVKPNFGDFKSFKRMLLEWSAAEMAKNPKIVVNTFIAIPYNPYEPKPYDRWTMKGMFDLSNEILVANEMWDFLGGPGTYDDLLDCFELAGIELRPQIDEYFTKFRNN
ncbi:MAG: TdeIII family type II restriction endonuclease [Chloroflexi bacterium]|nr:TdeIII family type II restriction endonuclease [Chloroflexota bacterium]